MHQPGGRLGVGASALIALLLVLYTRVAESALAQTQPCPQVTTTGCSLTVGSAVKGAIADPSQAHLWRVSLTETTDLAVLLTDLQADYRLYMYAPQGTLVGLSSNDGTADETLRTPRLLAGEYLIIIDSPVGQTSELPYTLLVVRTDPVVPPLAVPPESREAVLFSDSFDRPNGRDCAMGLADHTLGGRGTYGYIPIFANGAALSDGTLLNDRTDFGGVQLTDRAGCGARGIFIAQDGRLQVDLLVPTDVAGNIGQAGPYFRSRASAQFDGIIGGQPFDPSGGYWVQLHSTGEVKVKNLRSGAFLVVSGPPAGYDSAVFHRLEIAFEGTTLQVSLDGQLLTFEQDGGLTTTVAILGTNLPGDTGTGNQGTLGIAFGAETNRGQIGGQRADNLRFSLYSALAP